MSFKFLNEGQSGNIQQFTPIDTFIDPVSKIRVSNPSNLIDTDFEYGLQPTKWETVELINNTPAFFSKGGDTSIPDITSMTTNTGTREITVITAFPHGLDAGIPIRVEGTKSVTADGSYIINATPSPTTFTYLSRENQDETISIFDLYTSIITGEFFQGSQISIDSAEGITTNGSDTGNDSFSTLTVKTENKHGFGPNTPFYFLNLNSTIAQEFEASNTAAVSFDPTNSAVAQTFDGSNTLLQTPIDLSNSANTSIYQNTIFSTDPQNATITLTLAEGDANNWAELVIGSPLYYDISAGGGYFQNNPRGVVFIKNVDGIDAQNNSATFQVSELPDGNAIPILANITGFFQIADQAVTFAGNNVNEATQIQFPVIREAAIEFDGGNEETVIAGVQGYSGTTINLLVAQGTIDYYTGAMVLYSTDGNPPSELSNNSTYFVTAFAEGAQAGLYTMSIAEFPGENPISFNTTGSGTQTFKQIGVSLDKDIVHVKDSFYSEKDMLEYEFPETGNFAADETKQFYFVSTVYDQHNYKLNSVSESFIAATGGSVVQTIQDANGRNYTVHRFTSNGTFTLNVTDAGTFDQDLKFTIDGAGSSFGGATTQGTRAAAVESITVVVAGGGRVDVAYPQADGTNDIAFGAINPIPISATGGNVSDATIDGREYRLHKFTSTGSSTFTVTALGNLDITDVDVLIVAGGGSGGVDSAGGGGGGGVIDTSVTVTTTSYGITVGGGAAARPGPADDGPGNKGQNSTAFGLTALGGGAGNGWARQTSTALLNGGSGGGGSGGGSTSGNRGVALQPNSASGGFGNDGGNYGANAFAGGGGGAGGPGGNGSSGVAGAGGIGYLLNGKYGPGVGTNDRVAAGGTGGWDVSGGANASTVVVNNGVAKRTNQSAELPSPANTGHGGHGGNHNNQTSGAGGSGIVIVRYPLELETGGT